MRLRGRLLPFVFFALSASLLAQSNQPLFAPAVAYGSGGWGTYSVSVADVNGDGKPDIVIANQCSNYDSNCSTSSTGNGSVSVLLGNGDGTFRTPKTYASGGGDAVSIAVADVNSDGKADLLVGNAGGTVGVLLGIGDGTFQPAVTYGTGGSYTYSVAVADINLDGKPDLVVTNSYSQNIGVLLGSGDGIFQAVVNYSPGAYYPLAVAASDVDGDGKPDLVVASQCLSTPCDMYMSGAVSGLFGNADGTFKTAVSYNSGAFYAHSVAIADVNSDGKPDLLVANVCAASANGCNEGQQATVTVLIGIGDGTFQPAVAYGSGGDQALAVAVSDVNGDGKPDLLVANACPIVCNLNYGVIGVLLGNGDGSFQPAVAYGSGGVNSASLAVADVNGDGKPDLIAVNTCASAGNCYSGFGSAAVLINVTPSPYNASVQPPINSDNSSVFKANRGVIPVKFALTHNNIATCQLPPATIAVTRTAGEGIGSVDEGSYSMAADNGSNFRIDPTVCQYIYNLGTSLGVGTYEVDIKINGVAVGDALFVLK